MFCYWRRHPSKQHVTDGGCNQELLQGPCNQAPIFKPEPTHNVFVRKSGPVKLRGKAAEIKCLGEPLLAYWSTCCDETNEQHQQILYLLQMSCKCEEILFENKSALAFSHLDFQGRKGFYVSCPLSALLCFFLVKAMEMQQPSKKLSLLMGTWVTYSGAISKRLIWKKQGLFTCTSKTHAICHSALLSKYLNPRLVWCFIGEDMMSTVQQLTQACTKGNTPLSGPIKSLEHWRIAMHLEWQSWKRMLSWHLCIHCLINFLCKFLLQVLLVKL